MRFSNDQSLICPMEIHEKWINGKKHSNIDSYFEERDEARRHTRRRDQRIYRSSSNDRTCQKREFAPTPWT